MLQDIEPLGERISARRHAPLFGAALLAIWCVYVGAAASVQAAPVKTESPIERWDTYEIELAGPADGNPFLDVDLSATFEHDGKQQTVNGFYDGDGVYRIRFMPDSEGHWQYTTASNKPQLSGKSGELEVVAPTGDNHGPVHVKDTFHFAYADDTPFRQLGTTCYAWTHQNEALEEQTLKTLAASPFNKLRMCVFPKRYTWNMDEPPRYPFEGTPPDKWDFTRFNPEFFQHLELRVAQLRDLGIEADIILLHPYDGGHWGFDRMPDEVDDRYLKYVVSRLGAFRNVWWSMANEYDFMSEKQESDWDRMIKVVHDADPYHRLTSIHNGTRLYNHTNPLITHASIQNGSAAQDAGRAILYRDTYRKPVVFDEIKYEGDIPLRWGNLSAEEMVHRFWECIIAGTYPGHGETYLSDDDVLWWSKGGVLKGQSPARIAFLRDILADGPDYVETIDKWQVPNVAGKPGEYYLVYFGKESPGSWKFQLPRRKRDAPSELAGGMKFHVDVLDTWNMTVTPIAEPFTIREPKDGEYTAFDVEGRSIDLPNKPWLALRITRVDEG
jgi:Domain of unknown function (DUF5060)/Protein of unknown function (DUF4038)/Domain of unknown function (DUF5605)